MTSQEAAEIAERDIAEIHHSASSVSSCKIALVCIRVDPRNPRDNRFFHALNKTLAPPRVERIHDPSVFARMVELVDTQVSEACA